MPEKKAPLGICDLCGGQIAEPYTSKGTPRLYCSRDCRNTANSRAGNAERTRKLRERVDRGQWTNPAVLRPPTSEEQAARARKGRLAEVAAGVWRNPALTPAARRKLSTPRKHSGALASAIEKLDRPGGTMTDMTPEEQEAYRAYRREQQKALRAGWTDEERAEARRKWRAYKRQEYARKRK